MYVYKPKTLNELLANKGYHFSEGTRVFSVIIILIEGLLNITNIFIMVVMSFDIGYYGPLSFLTVFFGFTLILNRIAIGIWYKRQQGSTSS
jgi:hypothetical protein